MPLCAAVAGRAHDAGPHIPGGLSLESCRCARATDINGRMQPDWARFNKHGYGNNAVRPVLIDVV